jgi:hypothetical protein
MMPVTYVEATTALRDWLRTTSIADAVFAVGYSGLPADAFVSGQETGDLVGTVVGVSRVGGGVDLPFDRPLIQFDCWAPKGGAPIAAGQLAATLCTVLDGVALEPVQLDDVTLHGADIVSNVPLPGTHPRYVVTADVTIKAR